MTATAVQVSAPEVPSLAERFSKTHAVLAAILGLVLTTSTFTIFLAGFRGIPERVTRLEARADSSDARVRDRGRQVDFLVCSELERRGIPQNPPCLNRLATP
jgi:hypothetical protein